MSEAKRELHARSAERGKDTADAAHATKATTILTDVDADVRLAREAIEDAAVDVVGRKPDQRRVLEALRDDPLWRDLERVLMLALPPRLALEAVAAHVLSFL